MTTLTADRTTPAFEPARPAARRWQAPVALLGALLLLGAGLKWWDHARTWETTDNAFLAGRILTISPRIAGTVEEVLVDDGEEVEAGAVLARLDARDLRVRREKEKAALAAAGAQLAQARAQVVRDEAAAGGAAADFERARVLFGKSGGVISQADYDAARTAFESARGELDGSRASVLAAEAQEEIAAANLADVELQLGYTEITSPAGGCVGRRNIEPGNRVLPGQALMAVVTPEIWVTANFKETQIARLRPGQSAEIAVDGLPGRVIEGRLESFAPASGSQFALLPPDNATGNFTKVVQRVPVKIVFDGDARGASGGRMVPGMSVTASVRVRD